MSRMLRSELKIDGEESLMNFQGEKMEFIDALYN
jgi:hypothetical protein